MTPRRKSSYDEQVGARLREAMKRAKLSPEKTADKMGKSVSQIYRYFSGAVPVEGEDLARFAKLFNCQPGDFLNGIEVRK